MKKNLIFNITDIMSETAPEYVGRNLSELVSIWVVGFTVGNKIYDLHTIYDPETEYKNLVVADMYGTIINKINEKEGKKNGISK